MSRDILSAFLAAIFTLAAPALAAAEPKTFQVRADGGSRIQFVSDAPLETITGVSTAVTGQVTFDTAAPAAARGSVQVDTASLRTGIDLRDEHLRSASWLDARRFPRATFEIVAVEGATALQPNRDAQVRVRGRFTLHGVAREVTSQATVRWVPLTDEMRRIPGMNGDALMVRATFTVTLTDFGVSVPTIVRLKVANQIQVDVRIRAISS